MKTIHTHDVLRARLLSQAGIAPTLPTEVRPRSLKQLRRTQWSARFIEQMQARMVMGYFRYGCIHSARRRGVKRAHVDSIKRRLDAYLETGNQEHLVDAANICMCEVLNPSCHPAPHFRSGDDGEHAKDL